MTFRGYDGSGVTADFLEKLGFEMIFLKWGVSLRSGCLVGGRSGGLGQQWLKLFAPMCFPTSSFLRCKSQREIRARHVREQDELDKDFFHDVFREKKCQE